MVPGSSRNSIVVVQRVYDTAGRVEEQPVGSFVHHPSHEHWHFEQFAGYELWSRTAYDLWAVGGRGEPLYRGSKTTGGEGFCVRDSEPLQSLPRLLRAWVVPPRPVYDECGPTIQGISVGWVDVYPYFLPEQWIDLGPRPLPDGDYVVQVIPDPLNLLWESSGKADFVRENADTNSASTAISVRRGRIVAPVE